MAPPSMDEFALRLGRLEGDLVKHSDKDERAFKYSHHMLEDLGARIAGIERTGIRFEADLTNRNGNDTNTRDWLKGIDGRVQKIERLVWIAVGGVMVVGGTLAVVGERILNLLSHG